MRHLTLSRLDDAVARGIITAEQRDRLAELAEAEDDTAAVAERPLRREPRGLTGIGVAYHLGALLVLFAGAWFLLDRWATLRPGGVLVVSLIYAAAFAALSVVFARRGFRLAHGVAAALVVVMTPVIAWALANLAGVWAPYDVRFPIAPPGGAPWDSGRWLIPQLATIGVALAAARLVRYPLVIAPAAFAAWSMTIPLTELFFGLEFGGFLVARVSLVVGTILIAIGYAVDRRAADRGWAFWIYLFGAIAVFVGIVHAASQYPVVRHLSPLLALAAIALALRLGQRLFLVAGALGLVVYLTHLAFDVFAGTALFPIVLAALGLGIIVATVWLQRVYPRFAERFSPVAGGAHRVPGGLPTMLAPAAVALLFLIVTIPRERARLEQQLLERQRITEELERIDRERRRLETPERPI